MMLQRFFSVQPTLCASYVRMESYGIAGWVGYIEFLLKLWMSFCPTLSVGEKLRLTTSHYPKSRLDLKKTFPKPSDSAEPLSAPTVCSPAQLAKRWAISREAVYKKVKSGEYPSLPGRPVRIPLNFVEEMESKLRPEKILERQNQRSLS